jgi:hypothetical protein
MPRSGVRPGGRQHPRTPQNIAEFITKGVEQMEHTETPTPVVSPPPEPVTRPVSKPLTYEGPKLDPWDILRRELSPEALAALELVTGRAPENPGDAPWFECWDVREGRPSGHPPSQAIVKPGQHVYCPFVNAEGVTCGQKTVQPLEHYVPA